MNCSVAVTTTAWRGLKIYSTPETSIAEPAMIPILEKCVDLNSSYSRTQRRTNAST